MVTLVNLTPHAIVLQAADGVRTTIPPSGTVARVTSLPGTSEMIEGIPVPVCSPQEWGEITGLKTCYGVKPEDQDTMYIVSSVVLARIILILGPYNHNCVAPGTGPNDGAIREPDTLADGTPNPRKGQIVAVTRLVR